MKKLILLFSLTAILISCKSDDTIPENVHIYTENLSVIPFQLIKISSNTTDFSQEEYQADFGSIQIPLAKNMAGELIFLVPEVPPGDYEFVLTVAGRKGVLNFYVGINNPDIETTVFDHALEPLISFQEHSTLLLSQYNLTQQTVDRLNASNEMISDLINKYNTVSTPEKAKIAKFLKANKIFTENYNHSQVLLNNATGENLPFIVTALRFLKLSELFYSWNDLVTPALVNSQTLLTDDIIKVFTVVGMYSFSTQIESSIEILRDFNYYPVSVNIYDENKNSNDFNFQNNIFNSFNLKLGERRLVSEDINPPGTFVAKTANQVEFIRTNWEDFKVINPIVINSSNWFSAWLSPDSNYVGVSSSVAPLRQSDTVIERDGNSETMTLEGIPQDINYERQITSEHAFNLRFTAEQNSLPRTFQFQVSYEIVPFEIMSINITSTIE